MKKITGLLLFLVAGMLFAATIDVTKSEGTDQSIITSLTPAPASPEADANTTIKAVFNEALNPISTMHSVILKRLTGKKKKWGMFGFGISRSKHKIIQGSITYDQNENTLRFTPDQPLEVGYYEVSIRHLMKMKPGMRMRIRPIVYRFYVPEVINGFKLPPEPDEDKNNETLLGIDFNHNGIRDDVERWVIQKYANSDYPKHKTEIGLQWGRVVQQIIQSPQTAYEDKKYLLIDKAQECRYRTYEKLGKSLNYGIDNRIFNDEYVNKAFNTKERIKAYYRFNGNMSGHVFDDPYFEKPCDFDLAGLKE